MQNPLPTNSVRDLFWAGAGSLLAHLLAFTPNHFLPIPLDTHGIGVSTSMNATLTAKKNYADHSKFDSVRISTDQTSNRGSERLAIPGSARSNNATVFPKLGVSTVASTLIGDQHSSSESRVPVVYLLSADGRVVASSADLSLYRLSLARASQLVANPSPNKRQIGFEGRVVLNVSGVTGVGKLRVSVNQSSGNGALDDHALSLMNQAVQVAPIPDQLNRREFVIAVPVEYRLGVD